MATALPGYTITIGERPAATAFPTNASQLFMVGFSEKGSVTAAIGPIVSPADAVNKLGGRIATETVTFDSIEAFFREGGSELYFGRVNPTAVTAVITAVDSESKKDFKISAKSPGSWGNTIKVAITNASSKFKLEVKYESLVVETSPEFTTKEEAILWAAAFSQYIVISSEAESAAIPKTQEVTLTGGTYTVGSATATQKKEALALFGSELGPGQVNMPSGITEELHKALQEHAALNNRRAILDDEDTATYSTIVGHAVALRGPNAKFSTMVAPYAKIPGLSLGSTRTIPYSSVYAGQIARSEKDGNNPNIAAAGAERGHCNYALELTQLYGPAGLTALNESGVIAAKLVRGAPTTFGNVSLVNQVTEPNWKSFSASRLVMGVAAFSAEVLQGFEFNEIDGRGHLFSQLQTALSNIACMPYYKAEALYGETPEKAFGVNVGPDVNTPLSIANQEIKAQISLRISPSGEFLNVEIVKVPTTEELI